jgi:hypothetical protein
MYVCTQWVSGVGGGNLCGVGGIGRRRGICSHDLFQRVVNNVSSSQINFQLSFLALLLSVAIHLLLCVIEKCDIQLDGRKYIYISRNPPCTKPPNHPVAAYSLQLHDVSFNYFTPALPIKLETRYKYRCIPITHQACAVCP